MDIIESKRSSNPNLNVSISSKGIPLDELDTKKYKSSTAEKVTETCILPSGLPLAVAPAVVAAPAHSIVSRSDEIEEKNNNLYGWDTIKGRGWGWTGDGKQGEAPTNTNITYITDPELRKKWYGDYEHLWINFSKPPWNNRDNSYNPYASSNECSSESSSECSYNHKSKNK